MIILSTMIAKTWKYRFPVLMGCLVLIASLASAVYWPSINALFAPPPAPEPLSIAVSDPFGAGLVRIAAVQNYFVAEGLSVTLQQHTSGRSALNAALDRKSDMATVGDMPVMLAVSRKQPLSVIATISTSVDSEGILARRDRGIAAAADLRGKTIGVPFGTDAQFLLNVILASSGIAPGEVKLGNFKPEELEAALASGQVDAIAVWDPWLSKSVMNVGAAGLAFYPDKGYSFRFHLAGRSEFVRNHPRTMQKLLRALLRAQRFLEEQTPAARAILMEDARLDPSLFDNVFSNYSLRLILSQGLLTTLEDQARWAIDNHLTEAREVPNFLDAIYLDAMLAVSPQTVSIVR